MGDGRGGFVAAGIFGLVVISASAGSYFTLNFGNEAAYPRYFDAVGGHAVTQQPAVANRAPHVPCTAMASRDESDLCAQWRAATAAEHGAFWSFAQMVLSGAGLIGLFVTLWFNRRALEIADKSNLDARKIGQAQVKSYISIGSVKFQITEHGIAVVTFKLTNAGQSPAVGVKASGKVKIKALTGSLQNTLIADSVGSSIIASQSSLKFRGLVFDKGISEDLLDICNLEDDRYVGIWVILNIKYCDVFNNKYEVKRIFSAARPVWVRDLIYKLPRAQETQAMMLSEIARRKHLGTWDSEDGEAKRDVADAKS